MLCRCAQRYCFYLPVGLKFHSQNAVKSLPAPAQSSRLLIKPQTPCSPPVYQPQLVWRCEGLRLPPMWVPKPLSRAQPWGEGGKGGCEP